MTSLSHCVTALQSSFPRPALEILDALVDVLHDLILRRIDADGIAKLSSSKGDILHLGSGGPGPYGATEMLAVPL
jgi:hypothetical protein